MKRQELAHILRASCQIAHDNDILVMGSQAILGTFDDDELPDLVRLSREADIAFLDDPDRAKADAVEGAIGEMSTFHDTNRVYAEGVHIETARVIWSSRSSSQADSRCSLRLLESRRRCGDAAACHRAGIKRVRESSTWVGEAHVDVAERTFLQ